MVSGYKKSEIGLVPNDWDVLPFGEVFRTLSNNTLSRDQLNYDSGSIKDVHYGDVLILFPELLDCSRDDIPYVNSDAPLSCQSLQEGDVIISDTAEDETVGKAVEIVNQGKTNMVAGLHTIPCRVKNEKFASGWLGYFINSHYYHDQLLPYIHGTKVSSIARESLADTYIVKPSYEEQKRIVKALSDIGRLISESEELIAKYQAMKQGCLQHMFPRKDQTEPDMRLPGFSGAWEQRKLSELAEKTYGGGTPTTSNEVFWNGDIPWIQSSDVVDGKLFGVTPRKHITQSGLNSSAAQLIPKNSIAIITRVGVGKLAFMPYSYATSQDFLSLSKLNTEPFFTVYSCYKKLQSELNSVQGTSIKGITKGELLSKTIMVPEYAEQQQIGVFFSNLDYLITLHQRKCEKYKMIKQGMMEELLTGKVRLK